VHLDNPEEYVTFLSSYLLSTKITPPLIIMGHSLGGLLAARLVQRWPELIGETTSAPVPIGLVMLSPLFAVAHPIPTWKFLLGKFCFYLYPAMKFKTTIRGDELTSDSEKIRAWELDPLMAHAVSAGWFFHIQELIKRGNAAVNLIKVPTLILQSGDDHVVSLVATKQFFDKIPSTEKSFELLSKRKHELLNEIDRHDTMQKILGWINKLTE
jgi:lysophospholipase